jgi:mevalonate pyrophosphate decarboxylase
MDAGPHVKVLTSDADADAVATAMAAVPGVTAVTIARAGGAAELVAGGAP